MFNTNESSINTMDAKLTSMYYFEPCDTANIGLHLTYKNSNFICFILTAINYTDDGLTSKHLESAFPPIIYWMRKVKLNKRFINCDTKLFAC